MTPEFALTMGYLFGVLMVTLIVLLPVGRSKDR